MHLLAWNHGLCRAVLGVFARTVVGFYRRQARRDPERRRRGLIDLYRRQLIAVGFPLVTNFEMLDKGNRTE